MASPDVIELDALTADVAAFEKLAYPMTPPTLADVMKYLREQMGETPKEISMRAGIALSSWKHLENGKNAPSFADARKLYAVGIPAGALLGANAESICAATNL